MHLTYTASTLLAATAILASVPAFTAESICTLSSSETCAVGSLTPSDDDGSVLIYPGGNTRCAFDDYQDSVTAFSTNSTYFFQVFPNADLDNVTSENGGHRLGHGSGRRQDGSTLTQLEEAERQGGHQARSRIPEGGFEPARPHNRSGGVGGTLQRSSGRTGDTTRRPQAKGTEED
uniref:Pectate lyase n=1 Tax=Phytophthora ramorum TaxID=164328 RepID=H3H3R3_PHYRM